MWKNVTELHKTRSQYDTAHAHCVAEWINAATDTHTQNT